MLTRNKKKQFLPGELECKVLAEFRKKKVAKKSPKKIDDPLFNLIYRFLYVTAFLLWIFLWTESIHHTDYDPPEYLPLDISGHNLLLEAVQRSRIKAKPKTKSKAFNLKNFVKKNKYKNDIEVDKLTFETGI